MKPREFLLDITISMPRGKGVEDWSYVGHTFVDVTEDDWGSLEKMRTTVSTMIQNWAANNPQIHDCMENIIQTEEEYFCSICNNELTPEVERLLRLSAERKVHARAKDIVTRN